MPDTPQNSTLDSVLEPRPEDQPPLTVTDNQGIDTTVIDVTDAINENAAVSETPATATPVTPPADRPKWHDEPLSSFQLNEDGTVKMHPTTGKPVRGRGLGGRPRKAKPGEKLAGGGYAPGTPTKTKEPAPSATVIDPASTPPVTPDQANRNTPAAADDLDAAEVFTELADDVAQGVGGDKSRMTKAEKNTIQKGMGSMTRGRRVYGPLLFAAGVAAWCLRLWINQRKDATRDNEPCSDNREHEDGQVNPGQTPGSEAGPGF